MRRRILTTALAATGVLALSACSGGGGASSGMDARGPITIWYSNNDAEIAWGEQMVKAWNDANPDQQITAQEIPAGSSSEEVIGAAITAGNAPCLIFFNTSPAAVPGFERQGARQPLGLPRWRAVHHRPQRRPRRAVAPTTAASTSCCVEEQPGHDLLQQGPVREGGTRPREPATVDVRRVPRDVAEAEGRGGLGLRDQPRPHERVLPVVVRLLPSVRRADRRDAARRRWSGHLRRRGGEAVADFWRTIYADQLAATSSIRAKRVRRRQGRDGDRGTVGPSRSTRQGELGGRCPSRPRRAPPRPTRGPSATPRTSACSPRARTRRPRGDVLKFATSEEQDGAWLNETGQMPLRTDLTTTYATTSRPTPRTNSSATRRRAPSRCPRAELPVEIWQAFRDGYSKAVIFGEGDVKTSSRMPRPRSTSSRGEVT